MKIALVGAASSRKSTTAYTLTSILKNKGMKAKLVQEYAREYLEEFGSIEEPVEQIVLYNEQKKLEDRAVLCYDFVVCDSATFLSYPYFMYYYSKGARNNSPKFWHLAHIIDDWSIQSAKTFDVIFLLEPGEFIDDGVRKKQTDADRNHIYEMIKNYLFERGIEAVKLTGDVNHKISEIQYHFMNKFGIDISSES